MIKYTQYMIKRHVGRVPAAILAAMIILSLVGAAGDLARKLRQHAEKPAEATALVTQAPHYTGPAWCLVWGVGQPESCRGNLPECLAEDGSGPGVMCWFTDPDHGKLWLQYGDD